MPKCRFASNYYVYFISIILIKVLNFYVVNVNETRFGETGLNACVEIIFPGQSLQSAQANQRRQFPTGLDILLGKLEKVHNDVESFLLKGGAEKCSLFCAIFALILNMSQICISAKSTYMNTCVAREEQVGQFAPGANIIGRPKRIRCIRV